jgi:putative sterol carrier protein
MLDQSTNSFQVMLDLAKLLNGNERLLKLVQGWRRRVLFVIDAERYLIELSDRRADVRRDPEEDVAADISFTMDHATLMQIIREEITPITAKMTGRITSTGSLIEILRFVSILSSTVKEYNRQGGPTP